SKLIARDGEGATKLIEVTVTNAKNKEQARKMALNVVNSPLVKTAIAGADPNWGRIIAAAGKDPSLALDLETLEVHMAGILVLKRGKIQAFKRETLCKKLREKDVRIFLDIKQGKGTARAWGCDLTCGYVEINTEYS
ncbi:MAG: bifunctional ornithine acetyltransferase/N-acetylglutamate synthase, partial [Deltaproteobacteria bacterium]|nr:bifunctional ornithine acetyltransferase/N-acetylglutamate synthase [Deltaproteobacteria bacterium]